MGEEVQIDSLQIEIQTSSTNAAKGIDDLATALGKLKSNGSFKTVSTNLNHLSQALSSLPNVYGASNSLRTLANSIEKLKGVGTVASLSNSLKKLPEALRGVESINLESTRTKLQGLADAVYPLTQVKNSGFSSMVNSMAKLKKVTESLDTETLDRFAEKVNRLNAIVTPFATKMGTIKTALSGINTQLKQTNVSVEKANAEIHVGVFNVSNLFNVLSHLQGALQNIITFMGNVIHQASEWDGIAARFGRGFGEQAQETYDWIKRLNEEMGINIQQFMQYSSVYATMLTGFGVANEDAAKMALGYSELTYDIWAGYNDIYKTFDEAAEAVRSAIAGEVEPVRRAGFTIIESTLQQTAANHGLEVSIENATEAQKSYLRYLTLVDQAHAQGLVGTYAKEMNTAEGLMRTLSQQVKSLAQAFGSLFIPLLVKVLPYVQAFVELLKEGVYWLANLLGVEIQKVDFSGYDAGAGAIDNVANSAGTATDALDSATKAAKELKNATLGIDELNVISPPSASSGAGGGSGAGGAGSNGFAGLDVDSLWDESIFDSIQSDVDAIKEKMRGWLPVIGAVATALGGLRLVKLLKDIKAIEKTKLFAGKIKGIAGFVSAFASLAKEGGIIATLAAAFPKLSTAISGFVGNFGAFIALAKEGGVIGALGAAFPKLSAAISGLGSALSGVGGVLAGISAPVWIGIAAAIAAVTSGIYFLVKNWDEFKQSVKDFFAENIAPKLDEIGEHFKKMGEALEPIWTNFLKPIGDFFASIPWATIGKGLLTIVEGLGAIVVGIVGGAFAGSFKAIVGILENLVQTISGIITYFRGVVDVIIAIFGGGDIEAALTKTVDGIKETWSGIAGLLIDPVVDCVTGIIDWFQKMWDILVGHSIVPDTINAIVDWFTSLPTKIFGSVEKFVTGVVDKFANLGKSLSDKFSSAWESVKSWWSKKPDLSSYTPSIGNIGSKLSAAWTSAKDWWNSKRSNLSTYTPSIGSIYDKLKPRWDNAREWWNNKKSAMKAYTPSIGSIYEKVYDRWKNARDWWNSKKGSFKAYTPSIGSIVDKVKSAWNTAKSWWNKNVGGLSTKLNIKVPTIKVKWKEAEAFGKTFKYPSGFDLKFAAAGGIFDQGSLIWAGEHGAEIVANAGGNKTGVMNVQQMQEAVYEGVYSAVVAAMRGMGGGGEQSVNVYLDGRQITASVEKRQRERGASIMGNEVYSY